LAGKRREASSSAYVDAYHRAKPGEPKGAHNVTDYRDEAERVYNATSRSDSNRGVIAALLHVADLMGSVSSTSTVAATTTTAKWKPAALQYLQDASWRSKTAEEIRLKLGKEGLIVSTREVSEGMWQLHAEGKVEANTNAKPTKFSAAR
jgi:hypothetical protein